MSPSSNYLSPADCADLLRGSKSAVVLTGAGISTQAGIPDFRGPRGLYVTRRYDPERVFDIGYFHEDPRMFYEFTRDFMDVVHTIKPTFTHRTLAKLEEEGLIEGIITQNIDALHHHAGSRNVVEVHGSYWSATCQSCRKTVYEGRSYEWWQEAIRASPRSPVVVCDKCGGVVKPDVVFFGEAVRDFDKAMDMAERSDLMLVLGSSLAVHPAARLPRMTRGKVVVVNKGAVELSPAENRYFVDDDLDDYFSGIAERLGLRV